MDHPLRILADQNIPAVHAAFGPLGTVRTLPGRAITAADVRETDVLLVRSVTPVDAALLDGSDVQFVGSATTGTDHVDREALENAGVPFAHAPGANATSVADYVVAALLHLAARFGTTLDGKCLGVVGCGNIGRRVARRGAALGLSVLQNDPPRAEREANASDAFASVPLDEVLAAADILTLHVPLTHSGPHPTHHLINAAALDRLGPNAWLLNTSRGAVVDSGALRKALETGARGPTVLDVWEHEPTPAPGLLRRVDIATPHIAGYALDGKVRGTRMLHDALCACLELDAEWPDAASPAEDNLDALRCTPPDPRLPRAEWLHALAQQAYAIAADDARLRPYLETPTDERGAFFSRLRKTYPRRREMQQHHLQASLVPDVHRPAVRDGLTIGPAARTHRVAAS
jgi:erythronate-4-phosphate dehydrogenase